MEWRGAHGVRVQDRHAHHLFFPPSFHRAQSITCSCDGIITGQQPGNDRAVAADVLVTLNHLCLQCTAAFCQLGGLSAAALSLGFAQRIWRKLGCAKPSE